MGVGCSGVLASILPEAAAPSAYPNSITRVFEGGLRASRCLEPPASQGIGGGARFASDDSSREAHAASGLVAWRPNPAVSLPIPNKHYSPSLANDPPLSRDRGQQPASKALVYSPAAGVGCSGVLASIPPEAPAPSAYPTRSLGYSKAGGALRAVWSRLLLKG